MSAVYPQPFGTNSSRKDRVLIISLDYDSCFDIVCNSPSACHQRKKYELAANAARNLRAYIDSVSEGYNKVVIQNGSMRQDHLIDECNDEMNLKAYIEAQNVSKVRAGYIARRYTARVDTSLSDKYRPGVSGRCIRQFKDFVKAEKLRRDVDHSSWEFSKFSSFDGLRGWPAGDTYKVSASLNRVTVRKSQKVNLDKDKVDLLTYQMRYFKACFPTQNVDFLFLDDYPGDMAEKQSKSLPAKVPDGLHFVGIQFDSFAFIYRGWTFAGIAKVDVDRSIVRERSVSTTPFAGAGSGAGGAPSVSSACPSTLRPKPQVVVKSEGEKELVTSTSETPFLATSESKSVKEGRGCCCVIC